MRVAAANLVFDAMATALLQGALAAPPEKRDQLLAVLPLRARDGTPLSGMSALEEADLLDDNGRLTFPEAAPLATRATGPGTPTMRRASPAGSTS